MASLDFSSQDVLNPDETKLDSLVDENALGKRTQSGFYEVADYEDQRSGSTAGGGTFEKPEGREDSILASLAIEKLSVANGASSSSSSAQGKSAFSSFFSKLGTTAGITTKIITAADLQPVLNAMREHLMNKNVARDIADKICNSVGESLVGKKSSGFGDGGVRAQVREAIEGSLTRLLTSKTSTDILLDITRKRQSIDANVSIEAIKRDPYTITFVGVNGVGKSTNLSKVAFWLLQNRMKVLIAACDTFRSGAVEQLRIHVKNLGKLRILDQGGGTGENEKVEGRIELFEKGYGKDAAGIAKDAITYGE